MPVLLAWGCWWRLCMGWGFGLWVSMARDYVESESPIMRQCLIIPLPPFRPSQCSTPTPPASRPSTKRANSVAMACTPWDLSGCPARPIPLDPPSRDDGGVESGGTWTCGRDRDLGVGPGPGGAGRCFFRRQEPDHLSGRRKNMLSGLGSGSAPAWMFARAPRPSAAWWQPMRRPGQIARSAPDGRKEPSPM